MGIQITTVEVFELAMVLPAAERAQLATQLLLSLEDVPGSERSSAEQIVERFKALDERFAVAVAHELERRHQGDDEDEPIGSARLA